MKISYNKLLKMRSGQTVWRTWLYYDLHTKQIQSDVEQVTFCGKKVLHWFTYDGKNTPDQASIKFVWKAKERLIQDAYACAKRHQERGYLIVGDELPPKVPMYVWNHQTFLADAWGSGCFTSKRSAERYVQDVVEGRHPSEVEQLVSLAHFDRSMDDMLVDDMLASSESDENDNHEV